MTLRCVRSGVLAILLLIGSATLIAQESVTSAAISWRWPGSHAVVRGGVLERWDGPMAEPTSAEITQAVTDFLAQQSTIELDRAVAISLDQERLSSAIVWTILKQMYPADTDAQTKTKYGVARQRIIDAYKLRPWQ